MSLHSLQACSCYRAQAAQPALPGRVLNVPLHFIREVLLRSLFLEHNSLLSDPIFTSRQFGCYHAQGRSKCDSDKGDLQPSLYDNGVWNTELQIPQLKIRRSRAVLHSLNMYLQAAVPEVRRFNSSVPVSAAVLCTDVLKDWHILSLSTILFLLKYTYVSTVPLWKDERLSWLLAG